MLETSVKCLYDHEASENLLSATGCIQAVCGFNPQEDKWFENSNNRVISKTENYYRPLVIKVTANESRSTSAFLTSLLAQFKKWLNYNNLEMMPENYGRHMTTNGLTPLSFTKNNLRHFPKYLTKAIARGCKAGRTT